jgi:hypothetical protein
MASVLWKNPGTGGNWNVSGFWTGLPVGESFPGQVVANADSVTLGSGGIKTYTTTFNVSAASIGSLTITGEASPGVHTTTLRMTAGDTLTDSGGITLTNANSLISGAGTISVGGPISGIGTIAAGVAATSGGTLDLTGTGSIASGAVLAINNNNPTTLQLDLAGGVTAAAPISMNAANQTLKISNSAVTINGGVQNVSGGSHIVMDGGTLTAGSGIAFNTATLGGFGKVAADLTQTSGTNTVTASGTLDLTGTFGAGLIAAIDPTKTSDLKFDNAGTSSAAISITSANQTLEVGASGALTIGAPQNVTGGKIQMSGGTLTDVGGISFGTGASNGTLSGFGTVAANLQRAGSGAADTITASGTLDLTGTFGPGLVAAIDSTKASDLKFDGAATSSSAISINSGNQTLEIGGGGALTIDALQSLTSGTIKMDGGALTDAFGVTLGAGANLTGFGTFNPAFTGINSGVVTASGGTLDLVADVGVTGISFNIDSPSGSALEFSGNLAFGTDVTFLNTGGIFSGNLLLSTPTAQTSFQNNGTIVGMNVNTGGAIPTDTIDLAGVDPGSFTSSAIVNGNTIELLNGASVVEQFTLASAPGAGTFVDWAGDGNGGTSVFLSDTPCFAAGTRILTATGERMVESLLQGDIVLTLADSELSAQPVKWIGRRRLERATHPHPETVAPVCIQRGAFAEAMPHADLLVSPDHAVFVDGKLICARQLINGTTIYQEKGWASVEYFHVELDSHAILLAEGLPAESYLNTGNHGFFANSGEPLVLHPDLTDETDYPTRQAGSCAPFVWDEASVRPVWQRLAERAEAIGQPAPKPETTTDPDLRLVAKGRTVRPLYSENGLFIFALPKGATEVRLVSRAGAPTDTRPWLDDRRRLGIYAERIVLRGASEMREVPLDHPDVSQGWWAVERAGTALCRWTGGDAVLPLPAMDGATMLEIRAGNAGMVYLTDTGLDRRVA